MMPVLDALDVRDLYQDLILDHGKRPRNFRILAGGNHEALGHNPLCGDRLSLSLKVNDKGVIEDAAFQGSGCAISVASASMMTEMLKGKTVADARAMFDYTHFICTAPDDQTTAAPQCLCEDDVGRLSALSGVRHYPMRVKCATLAWHTFMSALNSSGKATTE